MKTILAACAAMAALCSLSPAAPVACPSDTTLSALIGLDANGGCTSQDKLFSNFAYTGGGSVAASSIDTTLVFTPAANSADIHGWVFAPVGGAWTSTFTISYDVASTSPGATIVAAKDQINSGIVPNGSKMTDTQTAGTLTTMGSAGGETAQITFGGLSTIHTSSTATFTGSSDFLQSYEQDWFEKAASSVPEPVSLTMIGGGLLLIGLRRLKKA